jgi:hypothetical protein
MDQRLRRISLWTAPLVVLATVGFLAGRLVAEDGEAQAGPKVDLPNEKTTPDPSATPDRSQPLWYLPYLNADAKLPRFDGELNGLVITPGSYPRTPEEDPTLCPDGSFAVSHRDDEALEAVSSTDFAIDDGSLPGALMRTEVEVWSCDRQPRYMTMHFEVREGALSPQAGSLLLTKTAFGNRVGLSGPVNRWSAGTVAGRPAVLLHYVIDDIGEAGVAVLNETGGVTLVWGVGVPEAFFLELMEALYR